MASKKRSTKPRGTGLFHATQSSSDFLEASFNAYLQCAEIVFAELQGFLLFPFIESSAEMLARVLLLTGKFKPLVDRHSELKARIDRGEAVALCEIEKLFDDAQGAIVELLILADEIFRSSEDNIQVDESRHYFDIWNWSTTLKRYFMPIWGHSVPISPKPLDGLQTLIAELKAFLVSAPGKLPYIAQQCNQIEKWVKPFQAACQEDTAKFFAEYRKKHVNHARENRLELDEYLRQLERVCAYQKWQTLLVQKNMEAQVLMTAAQLGTTDEKKQYELEQFATTWGKEKVRFFEAYAQKHATYSPECLQRAYEELVKPVVAKQPFSKAWAAEISTELMAVQKACDTLAQNLFAHVDVAEESVGLAHLLAAKNSVPTLAMMDMFQGLYDASVYGDDSPFFLDRQLIKNWLHALLLLGSWRVSFEPILVSYSVVLFATSLFATEVVLEKRVQCDEWFSQYILPRTTRLAQRASRVPMSGCAWAARHANSMVAWLGHMDELSQAKISKALVGCFLTLALQGVMFLLQQILWPVDVEEAYLILMMKAVVVHTICYASAWLASSLTRKTLVAMSDYLSLSLMFLSLVYLMPILVNQLWENGGDVAAISNGWRLDSIPAYFAELLHNIQLFGLFSLDSVYGWLNRELCDWSELSDGLMAEFCEEYWDTSFSDWLPGLSNIEMNVQFFINAMLMCLGKEARASVAAGLAGQKVYGDVYKGGAAVLAENERMVSDWTDAQLQRKEECDERAAVLGAQGNATRAELGDRHHRLALALHPDKNPGNEEAAQRFGDMRRAYEGVLLQCEEFRDEGPDCVWQRGLFPVAFGACPASDQGFCPVVM